MHTPPTSLDEAALKAFAEALSRLDDPGDSRRLLSEVLTPAELRDLALRWRLLQRLTEGVAQRTIAEELGISLCKITRGSRVLKTPGCLSVRLLQAAAAKPRKG